MVEVNVDNIKKMFGDFVAVEDSSLSVAEGQILTLLGPSGSGKSTILRMIAGLIYPTEGTITFGETDVTFLPPQERNTALVFQNYALFPHMSVRKNVEYGLTIRKIPKEERTKRVEEVLDRVQMSKFIDWMPNKLSGGQQQRIAVARALVVNPDVLLLDEPLSNLDAKLRVETRQEIRDLVKELNLTAIYVTHDQSEALSISDRIAVMEIGHIRQIGTPQEIWDSPETAFVGSFIGEANTFDMEVSSIHEEEVVLNVTGKPEDTLRSTYSRGVNSTDEKARVVIRPEAINVVTSPEEATNGIRAKVRTVQFFGGFNLIVARLADKTDLTIYDPAKAPIKRHQSVICDIDPAGVRSFGPDNY